MKDRLNSNGTVLSLREVPALPSSSLLAQEWCRWQLDNKVSKPVVWFLKDAVYHVLRPQSESGRPEDVYAAWRLLQQQGVQLNICQSACQRRMPMTCIDESVFKVSTLTQWADQLIGQLKNVNSGISCIVDSPAASSRFLSESIDPVLAILSLDVQVSVIFTELAVDHLLNEKNWRKWRMLPETEENVSLIVVAENLDSQNTSKLDERESVQLETRQELTSVISEPYIYV